MNADVVVIGGGAAGIAAARAASEAGASVVLVSEREGATAMSAGWITAADAALDITVLDWLPQVALRPLGIYAFVSMSGAIVAAVSGLRTLLDVAELPEGALLGVADLVAGPAWSAELIAHSLAAVLGREVRVVRAAAGAPRAESTLEFARALDTPGVADALAESLREGARGCAALLLPPVLGLVRDEVGPQLSARLGLSVGEVGGGSADATALRLARALTRALPPGVERVAGRASVRAGARGEALVCAGGREWHARAVVLATGGLVSGGLVFERMFVEPCAGAPVWLPAHGTKDATLPLLSAARGMDPSPLFTPDAEGQVEALRAGVRLDPKGRVAGPDGASALYPWLFAAGDVVCRAHGPCRQGLADALSSGARAGTRAARYALGQLGTNHAAVAG